MVAGAQLTDVLIDDGARLHIKFASMLRKMGLDITNVLTPTDAPFYRIIPGKAAIPLSQVTLLVTFNMMENYRTKYIKFEAA